jgi:hypothetical protein
MGSETIRNYYYLQNENVRFEFGAIKIRDRKRRGE